MLVLCGCFGSRWFALLVFLLVGGLIVLFGQEFVL